MRTRGVVVGGGGGEAGLDVGAFIDVAGSWGSRRLEVRPGCNRPVYAPRIIRSSSVSPGRGASSDRERICGPNTMARCSLSSTLF